MTVKANYSTPMLHVAEIEKSIKFYERLGFTTIDTDRCQPLGWAPALRRRRCNVRASGTPDRSFSAGDHVLYVHARLGRISRTTAGQRHQSAANPLPGIHAERRIQHRRPRRLPYSDHALGETRARSLGEKNKHEDLAAEPLNLQ